MLWFFLIAMLGTAHSSTHSYGSHHGSYGSSYTPAPTDAPTSSPTDAPTASPTDAPTSAPTNEGDTHAPTKSPTASPTKSPTATPTTAPYIVSGSVTLSGVTAAVAEEDAFQTAFKAGLAMQYTIDATDITIGEITETTSRRHRRLAALSIAYTIKASSQTAADTLVETPINEDDLVAKIKDSYTGTSALSSMSVTAVATPTSTSVAKMNAVDAGSDSSSSSLSTGSIAGIVVGLFAFVAVVGVFVVYSKNKAPKEGTPAPGSDGQPNIVAATALDETLQVQGRPESNV